MPDRQARLRPSFSDWYPKIESGKWHHALWAREVALAQIRKGQAGGAEGERVLPDLHFEFQGGLGVRLSGHEVRRTIRRLADGAHVGRSDDPSPQGTHRWRQAVQQATRVVAVMDEFGRSALPHAGHGPGTLGCHGLLHPQAKPVAVVSRMGTMG